MSQLNTNQAPQQVGAYGASDARQQNYGNAADRPQSDMLSHNVNEDAQSAKVSFVKNELPYISGNNMNHSNSHNSGNMIQPNNKYNAFKGTSRSLSNAPTAQGQINQKNRKAIKDGLDMLETKLL